MESVFPGIPTIFPSETTVVNSSHIRSKPIHKLQFLLLMWLDGQNCKVVWNVAQILYYLSSLDLVNVYVCKLTTVLMQCEIKGECCFLLKSYTLWNFVCVNMKIRGLVLDHILSRATTLCMLLFHWAGVFFLWMNTTKHFSNDTSKYLKLSKNFST